MPKYPEESQPSKPPKFLTKEQTDTILAKIQRGENVGVPEEDVWQFIRSLLRLKKR